MICPECDTPGFLITQYCRGCGYVPQTHDIEATIENASGLKSTPQIIFPASGQRVVPLNFHSCKVRFWLATRWLPEDADLDSITIEDTNEKEDMEALRKIVKSSDADMMPSETLGEKLCEELTGGFSGWTGVSFGGEKMTFSYEAKAVLSLKNWPGLNPRFIIVKKPEVTKGWWLHDGFGIQGFSCRVTLELDFQYLVSEFQRDASLVVNNIAEIIKKLYDWKHYEIRGSCSFTAHNFPNLNS